MSWYYSYTSITEMGTKLNTNLKKPQIGLISVLFCPVRANVPSQNKKAKLFFWPDHSFCSPHSFPDPASITARSGKLRSTGKAYKHVHSQGTLVLQTPWNGCFVSWRSLKNCMVREYHWTTKWNKPPFSWFMPISIPYSYQKQPVI